jgi:hypothetical protein
MENKNHVPNHQPAYDMLIQYRVYI